MKYLTVEEQKQLLKTVKEVKGAERDYVIIETLLNTGLRASELVAVTVGDVRNKQRLWVRPEDMKRGRGRFVPIHVKLQDLLHNWIRMKQEDLKESVDDDAPLFVSRLGEWFTKRSLQYMVEKWMTKAGLVTTRGAKTIALYSVHSLRHTFAIRFLDRNGQSAKALRSLQKILGHTSLASTGVYTEATDSEMAETMHMMSVSPTRAERLQVAI